MDSEQQTKFISILKLMLNQTNHISKPDRKSDWYYEFKFPNDNTTWAINGVSYNKYTEKYDAYELFLIKGTQKIRTYIECDYYDQLHQLFKIVEKNFINLDSILNFEFNS